LIAYTGKSDSAGGTMFEQLEGGCRCGRMRHRVTAAPFARPYCHRPMGQKN
jgi:hypothetical protein